MISASVANMIPKIQAFFAGKPVEKAWLFGSCSRGEETPTSDVDILVQYQAGSRISLFTISKLTVELEEVLQKPVDLIEDGRLLPFAQAGANHDKMLIYERGA